ncbi:MAG TPA: MFS transporter [Symbiobacteriaceae bacterium]|nr:MFS transporter [Symbiobacteriaceae bacterium]
MKQYRSLFRNRNFLLLWAGSAISSVGDFFNSIALVKVLSADPAHLGLWMALVMIAKVVPGVILGPVAGVVADRFPRRTVMIITDVLRAGLVAGLVFTSAPSAIITLCTLAAVVSTFHGPAYNALLPTVVTPEELVSANSLSVVTGRLAMLLGNGLGAVVMIFLGAHNVFYIDAASFLVSGALLLPMVPPAAAALARTDGSEHRSMAARFGADLKEALTFIRQTPTIRNMMITLAIVAFPDASLNVLMTTFFTIDLGLPAEGLGLLWALMGGTAVVGALVIGAIGSRVHWKYLISAGAVYIWACMVALLLIRGVISSATFIGLIGLGSGAINVGIQAAIGLLVPDQIRGRIFGGWGMINNLIYVIGALASGWLSDWMGASTTLMGFVTFYLLAGVYAWFAFRAEGSRRPSEAVTA